MGVRSDLESLPKKKPQVSKETIN